MARDKTAAYKAAYIREHGDYVRAGRDDEADTVAAILRDQFDHDVDGDGGEGSEKLETAAESGPPEDTAEHRVSDDEHECDECGFVAKSAAGLANHERSHDE